MATCRAAIDLRLRSTRNLNLPCTMSFGTGAGKGSLPRKVDLAKYASNYENIFGKKKEVATPKEEPNGPCKKGMVENIPIKML